MSRGFSRDFTGSSGNIEAGSSGNIEAGSSGNIEAGSTQESKVDIGEFDFDDNPVLVIDEVERP